MDPTGKPVTSEALSWNFEAELELWKPNNYWRKWLRRQFNESFSSNLQICCPFIMGVTNNHHDCTPLRRLPVFTIYPIYHLTPLDVTVWPQKNFKFLPYPSFMLKKKKSNYLKTKQNLWTRFLETSHISKPASGMTQLLVDVSWIERL